MTRSRRMEPVQRIADERARAAAKVYAELRARHEEQRGRLKQLRSFRDDYLRQRTEAVQAGMDGFRLRDYNSFIARIDGAIEQQQQLIAQTEGDLARARRQWMELRGKSRAIDKVVDRYQADERLDAERRDQRQSDELAQRQHKPPRLDGE